MPNQLLEEESPRGWWQYINQQISDITTAMPAYAKVAAMGADRVFYATRFSAWVCHTKDGLSTHFGVGVAATFASCAIVDNWWGRGYSMIRRERDKLVTAISVPRATWFHSGRVDATYVDEAGYLFVQAVSVQYMINSVPGSDLGALAVAKLLARFAGNTFNAFCAAENGEGPASYPVTITLAHLAGGYLAYSTVSSFLSYNTPQIRNYYNKLFIDGEIWDVKGKSWFKTVTGTLVNTIGIAFATMAAMDLLENELLCHAGIDGVPYWFKVSWTLQACIVNVLMNGMMTLYAVHMHDSNEHHKARHKLAKEIELSLEWELIIRLAILGNSIAAFCATEVQVPNLPGTFAENYKYLAYNPILITAALPLSYIALTNQLALSSESDVRERITRKEIMLGYNLYLENRKTEAELRERSSRRVYTVEEKEDRSIYDRNEHKRTNASYGSNGHTNGHINGSAIVNLGEHQPASIYTQRKSFCSRFNFFGKQSEPLSAPTEHDKLLGELQEGMTRYDSPSAFKGWGCGIM
jgi:hypothetical protein